MVDQEYVALNLQIPQEMMNRVDRMAQEQMLTRSDIVRHIIAREVGMLERDGEEATYQLLFQQGQNGILVRLHKWSCDISGMDEPITHYILEEVIEGEKFLTSLDKWSSVEYANQQAMHIRHAIQRFDELVATREEKTEKTTKGTE